MKTNYHSLYLYCAVQPATSSLTYCTLLWFLILLCHSVALVMLENLHYVKVIHGQYHNTGRYSCTLYKCISCMALLNYRSIYCMLGILHLRVSIKLIHTSNSQEIALDMNIIVYYVNSSSCTNDAYCCQFLMLLSFGILYLLLFPNLLVQHIFQINKHTIKCAVWLISDRICKKGSSIHIQFHELGRP